MTTVTLLTFPCLLLLLAINVTAFQWASTPSDGQMVYACANSSVRMPWKFTTSPGDVITSVTWNYRGRSEEMVAFFSQGNFIPLPSFSHRVTFVPDAGIVVDHLNTLDAGNYTVLVSGHDASGDSIDTQRTVILRVADSISTTDHELHAAQLPEAQWNNATHQFHAVISCGVFTFTADPPVNVEWTTPKGVVVPSTGYSQGLFLLHLANPVTAGTYTCRLTQETINASCIQGGAPAANVKVEGMETRMILMEASQHRLQAELAAKDVVIGHLTDTQRTLQDELTSTQHQLNNTQHQLNKSQQTFQAENAALKAQIHSMESQYQSLKNRSETAVAFTARSPNSNPTPNAPLILRDVVLNHGNGYSNTSGLFTAPLSGTYVFSAFTLSYSGYAILILYSNSGGHNRKVFYGYAYNDGHYQNCAVQGALSLRAGEQVWVQTHSISGVNHFETGYGTAFSGFLLTLD